MEKKYYDLIITLIKNHKKYIGLESILNDIAEDVYNRAQTVMYSITERFRSDLWGERSRSFRVG